MNDDTQVAQPATQEVRIGFEAALDAYYPEWKSEWNQTQVDLARFFYQASFDHQALFVSNAINNLQQGYQAIAGTIQVPQSKDEMKKRAVATAAAELAAAQKRLEEAQAAVEADAPVDTPPDQPAEVAPVNPADEGNGQQAPVVTPDRVPAIDPQVAAEPTQDAGTTTISDPSTPALAPVVVADSTIGGDGPTPPGH